MLCTISYTSLQIGNSTFNFFAISITADNELIPSTVIFLISTISSRCQRFDFYKLTIKEIVSKLEEIAKKEDVIIEKEALELIAASADGALRDAEGIFDQILNFVSKKEIKVGDIQDMLGLVDLSLAFDFTEFLIDKNIPHAIKYLNENIERGLNIEELSKTIINFLRKLLILKINKDLIDDIIVGETKETKDKMVSQSEIFKGEDLKLILNLLLEAESKRKFSSIAQLPFELALVDYFYQSKKS